MSLRRAATSAQEEFAIFTKQTLRRPLLAQICRALFLAIDIHAKRTGAH